MPRFLHAMSGGNAKTRTTRLLARPDWQEVRLDPAQKTKPDIPGSLLDMRSVPQGAFDAVYVSHNLERLYPHQVGNALGNCLRSLKEDGHLVVICADLQAACAQAAAGGLLDEAYASPAGPVTPLDILYGYRPALAAGHLEYACHCGFTAKFLLESLLRSGFASVQAVRNAKAFSIIALATRRKRSEAFLAELAKSHFG
ncbi:MAG: hypothetical protein LBO77_02165 [Desulfovibrio sp.]|jgi:SAM-dependent methyltransferase|nr:hypothetical protein [Desulfovibrio sp.]